MPHLDRAKCGISKRDSRREPTRFGKGYFLASAVVDWKVMTIRSLELCLIVCHEVEPMGIVTLKLVQPVVILTEALGMLLT